MDDYKKRLVKKIEQRFLKSHKGSMVLKLKDERLIIRYMHGNKYSITRQTREGKRDLEIMAKPGKIADIIIKEKNPMMNKLKGLTEWSHEAL